MPEQFKVSIYIRVSTDRQATEGDSLDEQERELKRFCEFKGYMIHRTHIEPGRSAKDTKRPEYQKLMADIEAEKINAVVVKKLDRLSRSLMDFEGFMTVAQTHNVEFISLKENFDTTNAMGKAMLRVALVFAQLEREQTSERVSDVFAYRAQNGQYNGGTRPYGYVSLNAELMPDKKEARTVELMFEKFLELKSTVRVADFLNSIGLRNREGKLWDKRRVDDMLRRPVYTGNIRHKGTIHKGIHQPIILEKCFNLVQDIFGESKRFTVKTKTGGILKGFIYCCYCPAPILPNYTRKANGKKYFYYRCGNTVSYPNQEPCSSRSYYLQESVEKAVFSRIIELASEAKLTELRQQIASTNIKVENECKILRDELAALEGQQAAIKAKKEKYLDSLVHNNYRASERQRINEKIEEFTLEEKQIKAAIYRQQFDLSARSEQIQTIEPFKEVVVGFKINYPAMSQTDQAQWLRQYVNRITYGKESIDIEFKVLKSGS